MPDVRTIRLEIRGNLRKFFNGMKDAEVILDGPAGTGKTHIILQRQHYILHKYPLARGLMMRKYRSSMSLTCMKEFKEAVLQDEDDVKWRERDQLWEYPNGAIMAVAGMDDPTKIMSSQWDFIYWNECIEGKLAEWEAAKSRLRNFKVPYQQMIGDTNPGPPSHWIPKRAKSGILRLLPTTHKDNPVYWDSINGKWTQKGEMYVNDVLRDGLTGLRRKRLYEGKWVAAEGQVYDQWTPEVHVVPWFSPPKEWPSYWAFDFGYIDPFVWQQWFENPETGDLYLCRELYHTHMRTEVAADYILETAGNRPPMALICDHDAEDRATLETKLRMLTLPAHKSIHPGIKAVQTRMSNAVRGAEDKQKKTKDRPGIFVMEGANIKTDPWLLERHKPTCTLEEMEGYVWDTANIGMDKYKDMPVDRDNHGCDPMRYVVAFVDNIAVDPQEWEETGTIDDIFGDDSVSHALDTMISVF